MSNSVSDVSFLMGKGASSLPTTATTTTSSSSSSTTMAFIRKNHGPSLLWLPVLTLVFILTFMYISSPFRVISGGDPGATPSGRWREAIVGGGGCNLFDGRWVRDLRGSSYLNSTCPMLPESKNCGKYGKEQDFVNWRWKPHGCELPRFDALAFLEMAHGKTMAFVADSVGRNQMESLLCILSQVELPVELSKGRDDGFQNWHFKYHNFSIMLLWSRFLVMGTEQMINGTGTSVFVLHLDKVDTDWTVKLHGVNYLIISDAHWFFRKLYLHEDGKLIGCVFCSDANVTQFSVSFAVRRALRTALQSIIRCQECDGLFTLLRTFSPAHFENGGWNTGGYCNRTEPLPDGNVTLAGTEGGVRDAQLEELGSLLTEEGNGKGAKQFGVLDVTRAMMLRPDGHPGSHWNNEWMKGYNDCVHWCLPGPVDAWNDMMFAVLKRGR